MDARVPRRDLLKTLGAAAAVASTACQSPPQPDPTPAKPAAAATVSPVVIPRVNLICHGMLLLWQDKGNRTGGITIYAPRTQMMHQVRLSSNIGGLPNLLKAEGIYSLKFTKSASAPMGAPKKEENLVLFDDGSKGLEVVTANAQYTINVPYPTRVRRHRLMGFPATNPPYATTGSDTQATFEISPLEMAGVNVLTYDNVSSAVSLEKPGGGAAEPISSETPRLLNLYLYASSPDVAPVNHLRFFNSLLKYTGHAALDLQLMNKTPATKPPDQEVVDDDLSRMSVYDLREIEDLGVQGSDPVGCIQGWGS